MRCTSGICTYINHEQSCICDLLWWPNLYREDLIYDRETGTLIGYTDLGEVNNHLQAFERSVSGDLKECRESILSFMVKGLFTPFKFPYVHFSASKPSGDNIFPLFWEVVKRLERIGLKVTSVMLCQGGLDTWTKIHVCARRFSQQHLMELQTTVRW